MGKFIDITNQRFGRLIVKEKTNKRNSNGAVIWLCECDCGKEIEVAGTLLRNKHTQSCGCYYSENLKKIQTQGQRLINRIGQKYGLLTVLERVNNIGNKTAWKCQCQCGNIKIVTGDSLQSGKCHSCGCIKTSWGEAYIKQILEQANIAYECEKTFPTCIFINSQRKAKFDFYVNNQYIIEFDGKQHYEQSGSNWGEPIENIQKRDMFKNKWCKENNIPLIRIPYTVIDKVTLEDLLLETSKYII